MTKIMVVCPKDGTFYFRKELILRLHEMDYEVVLVGPYGDRIPFFEEKGIRFVNVNIDRRGTNAVNDLKLIKAYYSVFKREMPNVVLLYTTKCSVYGGLVASRLKIPYIVNNAGLIDTGNNKDLLSRILRILYKLGFRNASCMMYQNKGEHQAIEQLLGKKLHYRDIPGSGVNLEEYTFTEYPQSDSEIYFNTVGRVMESKGIKELIECARIIKKEYPYTHFRVFGDYVDDEIPKLVNSAEVDGIIEYKGVSKNIKPEIVAAHAIIHPSHYEGMANVILEHGAMGRPCIGSDVPGVMDGIEDGITGYVFHVRDAESMAIAVKRFIELPLSEKKKMGAAARRKMESQFNRDIVTDTYIQEIELITKRG